MLEHAGTFELVRKLGTSFGLTDWTADPVGFTLEDYVQEVMVRVFNRGFLESPGRLNTTLLYLMLRNIRVDRNASRRHRTMDALDSVTEEISEPEAAISLEDRVLLTEMQTQHPEEVQLVFAFEMGGLPAVAELVPGRGEAALYSLVDRARHVLRKFGGYHGDV